MPKSINEAFAEHGMRAMYNGNPAMVLPITQNLLEEMNADTLSAQVGQNVGAGQLMVSWNEGERRNGQILSALAGNDIVFVVPRNDGEMSHFHAADMTRGVTSMIEAEREARREVARVAEENATARADYAAAVERGEHPEEPVDRVATFDPAVFSKVPHLLEATKQAIAMRIEDPFADIVAKSRALSDRYEIGRVNTNVLTADEMAKITEERSLREAIGAQNPGHPLAIAPAAQPYDGDSEAARNVMDDLGLGGDGFSPQQLAALAGNDVIRKEVFSVLTTTPVNSLSARMISANGYESAVQSLARHEERNWAPQALGRVSEVLADRMPGYRFDARMFSHDGADVLLIRDHAGAYAYSWDSESRVAEFDVRGKILSTYGPDDVPSDERLHELRVALQDVRFDNRQEIDFTWNDQPEEDNLEDDDLHRDFRVDTHLDGPRSHR